jgi:hypothetical protein
MIGLKQSERKKERKRERKRGERENSVPRNVILPSLFSFARPITLNVL